MSRPSTKTISDLKSKHSPVLIYVEPNHKIVQVISLNDVVTRTKDTREDFAALYYYSLGTIQAIFIEHDGNSPKSVYKVRLKEEFRNMTGDSSIYSIKATFVINKVGYLILEERQCDSFKADMFEIVE